MPKSTTPKQPTPVGRRSHAWRFSTAVKTFGLVRPSKLGIARYGIKDLGWKPISEYVTKYGLIKKQAQA